MWHNEIECYAIIIKNHQFIMLDMKLINFTDSIKEIFTSGVEMGKDDDVIRSNLDGPT